MFSKKIEVRIAHNPEMALALATAWGIIENRPLAKARRMRNYTVFYLTEKERKSLIDIVKIAEIF